MKKIDIHTNGYISIDNQCTGLAVSQRRSGTVVYTINWQVYGTKYKEHPLPHNRYSLAHDAPASGNPGRLDFERDLTALLDSEGFKL